MTRKLLSGVLAFAMVFGCTAPVALAEETVVEEVEQYTVYAPSLSKDTVELAEKGDTATVTVSDVADNATVELKGPDAGKFSATLKDRVLTITAEEKVTAQAILTVEFSSVDSNGDADAYKGTVTLTVKVGKPAKYTIKSDEKEFPAKLAVGKTFETTVYGMKDGVRTGAPTVKVELNDVAQKYFSVSTKNYTENNKVVGTTVVLTAIKAMSEDEYYAFDENVHPAFRATVTYETADQIGPFTAEIGSEEDWYTRTVNDTAKAPQSISMTASTTSTTINTPVALAAKVMVDDGFGGIVADDDADVVWYINGAKITDTVHEIKNLKGETLAELIPDGDVTAAMFTARAAGTYKITVETADGNCIAIKTITASSNVGPEDSKEPWLYTDDIQGYYTDVQKATKVGGTVDLSGLKFAAWGTDGKEHPISDFNATATLKLVGLTAGTEPFGSEVAKKVATIKDGVVTIADETNETMAELLKIAGKKPITINLTAEVKFSDTDKRPLWTILVDGEKVQQNEITILVTKSSDTVAKVVYTIGDKEINKDSDGNYTKTLSMPVLTVGKTVDVNATLYDKNDFTDGINQGIIWEIQNTDPADKNVYATVDANGVVTPVAKCTGKAELVAVPVADTTKVAKGTLYIMEDPTATVAPTAAPTAAPTQAPETKTGTVNTSSSALNIRAAASTTAGVVTKAAKGSTVTILGEENGFYKVKLADGTIGYASKAYIKVTTDTPVVTITATTTANLKLRTSAPSGSVITVMPKGATVKVIEGGQSWAKVEYNGKVGYASNNYLTFNTVG